MASNADVKSTDVALTTNLPDFDAFLSAIKNSLSGNHIIEDLPRRTAFATDASFYTLIPKLVVKVASIDIMKGLIASANEFHIPLTFRAAGTSLSGQAITDSVLVLLTRDWDQHTIIDNGTAIALAPGIIGASANRILAPYQRKIGPDPASINACKIGGIAANNASGMCCGVKNNSYHTLRHMHVVLADGSEVNTACDNSVAQFTAQHSSLLDSLSALRNTLIQNTTLADRVRHQYRLKNTMGYGLNALLDFEDPVAILTHLMIGSEGTLGFIANITYNTVPVPQARQTALYLFDDFDSACGIIPALKACNVDAVELMDSKALQAVSPLLREMGTADLGPSDVALLIDVGGQHASALTATVERLYAIIHQQGNGRALCDFTADPTHIEKLWHIRKGLFPAVGAVRPRGTTVIIEDVAFPLDTLAKGLNALVALFEAHGYFDAIIFGHALDGNVHFVFSQGFDSPQEVTRYHHFMQAISVVVTHTFKGSLKAEHGTGRNMAPFLTAQWGNEGVAMMRELKRIIDPKGILNPGVILNDNPSAHITHLKPMPPVSDLVDACIECGFCEPQCPSLHYTLSPRQRIALKRRQQSLLQQNSHDSHKAAEKIEKDFTHLGLDSCAATGLCATACPVGIDTGEWVKQLRSEKASHKGVTAFLAAHNDASLAIAKFALKSGHVAKSLMGSKVLNAVTNTLHLPHFPTEMPHAARTFTHHTHRPLRIEPIAKLVYMISCPSKVFASSGGQKSITDAIFSLCEKAGIEIIVSQASNLCCGQPWQSEGHPDIATQKKTEWIAEAQALSENGRWPIITDNSACALMSKSNNADTTNDLNIEMLEVSEYLLQHLTPHIKITKLDTPLLLHVSCSSVKMDKGQAIEVLANLCADDVYIPSDITCCGFAGTKGFTQPELNRSALFPLQQQVPENCHRGVTNSRTCAIGLSQYSGVSYSHIAVLLDEISQSRF